MLSSLSQNCCCLCIPIVGLIGIRSEMLDMEESACLLITCKGNFNGDGEHLWVPNRILPEEEQSLASRDFTVSWPDWFIFDGGGFRMPVSNGNSSSERLRRQPFSTLSVTEGTSIWSMSWPVWPISDGGGFWMPARSGNSSCGRLRSKSWPVGSTSDGRDFWMPARNGNSSGERLSLASWPVWSISEGGGPWLPASSGNSSCDRLKQQPFAPLSVTEGTSIRSILLGDLRKSWVLCFEYLPLTLGMSL